MAGADDRESASGDESAPDVSREMCELQTLLLGVLAHEIGNITSPVAMLSETVSRIRDGDRALHAARMLQRVASRLNQMTSITRVMRGGVENAMPLPGMATTREWSHAFTPFLIAILPPAPLHVRTTQRAIAPEAVAALSWGLSAAARLVSVATDQPIGIALTVRSARSRTQLQATLDAWPARGGPNDAARWIACLRHVARVHSGTVRAMSTPERVRIVITLPASEPAS